MEALRPWQVSLLFHLSLVALVLALGLFRLSKTEVYEVPITMSAPPEVQNLNEVKEQPKVVLKSVNEPIPEAKKAREVFGASRESYTDKTLGAEGVEAKKGNTLAKEVDQTKLLESDVTNLPTPTEEYLVSEMPVVLSEVRPLYPKEAKEKKIEGVVVLAILIDEQGLVRQVSVIEGPEVFKTVALEAMKKFRFKPAKVDGRPVAVRIRYSLNFKLEF